MIYLRIFLFSGMLLHKAVWEWLKRDRPAISPKQASSSWNLKRLVKLAKSLVLVFLLAQTLFLDLLPISANPFALRVSGVLIYLVGLFVAVMGRVQLGHNWSNLEDYQVLPEQALVRSGIYQYIRHPIYAGDLLLILGLELALNSWLVLGGLVLAVIVFRQAREEEAMLAQHLPGYAVYRSQTKMFIPFVV